MRKGIIIVALCGVVVLSWNLSSARKENSFVDTILQSKQAEINSAIDLPILLTVASVLDYFRPRPHFLQIFSIRDVVVYLEIQGQEFPQSVRTAGSKVGIDICPYSDLPKEGKRKGTANWIHVSEVHSLGPNSYWLEWVWQLEIQGVGGRIEVAFKDYRWAVTKFTVTSIS